MVRQNLWKPLERFLSARSRPNKLADTYFYMTTFCGPTACPLTLASASRGREIARSLWWRRRSRQIQDPCARTTGHDHPLSSQSTRPCNSVDTPAHWRSWSHRRRTFDPRSGDGRSARRIQRPAPRLVSTSSWQSPEGMRSPTFSMISNMRERSIS